MEKIKVSINKIQYKQNPPTKEIEALDFLVASHPNIIARDRIKSFVDRVGSKGCTFCPSTFTENRKSKETFEQSQLLALSFDSFSSPDNRSLTFQEIRKRAEKYDLPILFAYDSYSIANRKKFGVVFLNSTPFSSIKEAEVAQKILMKIFPEADKDCSVLKLYLGGNKVIYFDDTLPETNVYSLAMSMCFYLKDKHGISNYKRKIAEFSKDTGVRLNDKNLPDIFVDKSQAEHFLEEIDDKNMTKCTKVSNYVKKLSTLSYKIRFVDEGNSFEVSSKQEKSSSYNSFRDNDLQSLSSTCHLYQDFISGKRKLDQWELLGLATNVVQIRGGATRFENILSTKSYYENRNEKYSNWNYYLKYIKADGPRPCSSFCPHHNTCPHGKNILSTLKPKKHKIERITNFDIPFVDIDDAYADFTQNFFDAVESDIPGWHIIKSQTALGKTEAVLLLLKNTTLKILIAVPTNKLKREIYERAKAMGIDIIVSPSLHELKDELPASVWCKIQALYDAGKSPMPFIEKAIAEDDPECAKLFKQYKKELDAFMNADGHAITTHRRLPSLDASKYNRVIVDEDILYSTVIPNRETISISELKKAKKESAASDLLAAKIKKVLKKRKHSKYFTVDEIDYDKTYSDINIDGNIPAFCSAKYFCYRAVSDQESDLEEDSVTFIKSVHFQENVKYIMLSATANRDICEYYFGEDNVTFYNCKEAEITGELRQYGDRAMGRSSMRKDPSMIKKIKEWTGFEHTISFKEFHKYYTGDLHFGNCAGCDTLKGENIDVIGTPHQPEWIYKLFAFSLGFDIEDTLKLNTRVTHNGFRFRFMTYEDEDLRNIQFYIIESELEQAVGRARLLRCDCIVNLFSDFPLRQAVLKEAEYDDDGQRTGSSRRAGQAPTA